MRIHEEHENAICCFVSAVMLRCCLGTGRQNRSTSNCDPGVGPFGQQCGARVVSAADAMPEDKYSFAPTNGEFKGVRTFAQQVKHVAATNYLVASGILGEKPPVEVGGENGPDSIKSKADIIKFLKDLFAYAHKAVTSVDEKNMVAPM